MTAASPDSVFIPVAVVVERRPSASPWAEHSWRAVEVLEEAPELPPWTVLRQEADGRTLFLAGRATVALHPTDTSNHKHNLDSARPSVWVVLRPDGSGGEGPGMTLHAVTVDAGEAHLYADVGNDLLEALPLPPFLAEVTAAFVAQHHRERGFWKRRRDRDPEWIGPAEGRGERRRGDAEEET